MELLDQPFRIYAIGDAHSLAYKDLIVHDHEQGQNYLALSSYCPEMQASKFIDERGAVNASFLQALYARELITQNSTIVYTSITPQDLALQYAAGHAQASPLLLVLCGEVELRQLVMKELKTDYDLILPFETPYGRQKNASTMPLDTVAGLIQKILTPLLQGLTQLKNNGFPFVYYHAAPPPTRDDQLFEKINQFPCPLDTRYKSVRLFNYIAEEICKKLGLPFMNPWNQLTKDGYLLPEFERDGVHLNRKAASLSLELVLEHALNSTPFTVNLARYELALKARVQQKAVQAKAPIENQGIDQNVLAKRSEEFKTNAITTLGLGSERAESLRSKLDFKLDTGNRHARLDWSGNALKPGNPNLMTAEPSESLLQEVFKLMYSEEVAPLIQACAGGDVVYLNCRPIRSTLKDQKNASGPQNFHRDGCPPGVFRAILYLTDVNEETGPFEYYDDQKQLHRVQGEAGTLLIFDANRIVHRGSPVNKGFREVLDFCIMPRVKSMPRRVFWAGMNNWPADPFQFSLHGMKAFPALEARAISLNPCAL